MSDEVWFHTLEDREAMLEAERVGTMIERHGPRYVLRHLMVGGEHQHFVTLEELREEVRARLKRRLAEAGEHHPELDPVAPPQRGEDQEHREEIQHHGAADEDADEADDEEEDTPTTHGRAPVRPGPRRRR